MRWSYKTIHFELKKDGLLGSVFLDESEMEETLNEFGRAGWELVSLMDTRDGIIGVFKQPMQEGSTIVSVVEKVEENRVQEEAVSFIAPEMEPESEVIRQNDEYDPVHIDEVEEIPELENEAPSSQEEEAHDVPDVGRIKIE